MKRILLISLAAVLLLTAVVSGHLGYESMKSGDYSDAATNYINTADAGSVDVRLIAIKKDPGDKIVLYPLDFDESKRQSDAYTVYSLKAENTGTADEFIRFYVAVPTALDNGALHMDVNTDTSEDNTTKLFTQEKLTKTTTIKGMEYSVYAITYNKSLPARYEQDVENPQTPAAVYGFYLDEKVNLKGHKIYYDGKDTGFENDTVEVYSVVHGFMAEISDVGTFEDFVSKKPGSVPNFYDKDGNVVNTNN